MPKISALNAITNVQDDDLLAAVDVHDQSMAPTGTDKKLTLGQLYGSLPWQFPPENYGAKGDGRLISDGSVTASSNVLTSGGIPAPAAPGLATAASGGTILAGTYQVEITYVNPYGESLPSASASITTTGSASTITITAPVQMGDATGWYAYVTQLGGSTYTRQQTAGSPSYLGGTQGSSNLTLTAPPTATGAAPPVTNTTPSNPFTPADVGKNIMVWAGGASTQRFWYSGTITGYTSASTVTMSVSATFTVAPTGVAWGTDDTAAVQAAINAATAYSVQGNGAFGEVVFRSQIYVIAGPAVIGGTTMSNAQLTLPFVDSYGGNAAELRLTGTGAQEQAWVWQELPPQNGTILLSMRFDATIDGTYGYPFVIGGATPPSNDQSNMTLTVDDLNIMVPGYYSGTPTPYGGLGLQGILSVFIGKFSYLPVAIEAFAVGSTPNPSWPQISGLLSGKIPTTNIGINLPVKGNKGLLQIETFMCEWAQWALVGSEHLTITNLFTYYCAQGWAPSQGGHGAACLRWACQATAYPIDANNFRSGGQVPINIVMLDLETWTAIANDPGGHLYGSVNFQSHDTRGTNHGNQILTTGGVLPNLQLTSNVNSPGAITAPTFPSSGVATGNYFYRNAIVYLTNGDGSVTAITVDNTATGLTLSGAGTIAVPVPSGHSITLTYTFTSTAPTWTWILN